MYKKIINYIIGFTLLTTVSCGSTGVVVFVSEDAVKYVNMYEEEFDTKLEIPVILTEIPSENKDTDILGLCVNKTTILLNIGTWYDLEDYNKYNLLLHEIGHCVYNFNHVNVLDSEGYATDIMHPRGMDKFKNEEHFNKLKEKYKERVCHIK